MLSRGMVIGLIIAAGLVVIAGAGIFLLLNTPEASQQLPDGTGAVQVYIQSPLNNAVAVINKPVTIYASAFGESAIKDLQLSINGILLPKKLHPDLLKEDHVLSAWSWTPTEEGQFTLLAKASTKNGLTGLSNAVQLQVIGAAQEIPETQAATGPIPDTVKIRVNEFNAMLGKMMPIDAPQSPLARESNRITFTVGSIPVDTSEESAGNSISPKYLLLLQGITSKINSMPQPEAPVITGSPGHCSTVLRITDQSETEAGFFLYRLDPNSQVFSRVATLNSHPGTSNFTYTDQDIPSGKYGYYLSAFNAAGETNGDPVFVDSTGTDCRKPLVRSLDFAALNINPGKPVDNMYCYMSTDGTQWNRIPAGRETFVNPKSGKFDFAPYLPNAIPESNWPEDVAIGTDCWGWKGESLEYLGRNGKVLPDWNTRDVVELDLVDPGNMPDLKDIFPDETTKNLNSGILKPYNLHIGYGACSVNVQTKKETCTEVNHQTKKRMLFWDWDQYPFECPESDPKCDFYPAQSYRIYYKDNFFNHIPIYLASVNDPDQKFFKSNLIELYNWVGGTIYFTVRAYNSFKGESNDSNEVAWLAYADKKRIEPDYINSYFSSNKFYSGQQIYTNWFEFLDEYPRVGYNNSCASYDPNECWHQQENLLIEFTLPDDVFDVNSGAELYWSLVSTASYGAGTAMESERCNYYVSDEYEGPISYEDGDWYNPENRSLYITPYEINNNISSGNRKIRRWLIGPMIPKPTSGNMDFCEIGIGNVYLEYYGGYN